MVNKGPGHDHERPTQDTAKLPDATITDTATLAGVTSNAGGEIIFKLHARRTRQSLRPAPRVRLSSNLVCSPRPRVRSR